MDEFACIEIVDYMEAYYKVMYRIHVEVQCWFSWNRLRKRCLLIMSRFKSSKNSWLKLSPIFFLHLLSKACLHTSFLESVLNRLPTSIDDKNWRECWRFLKRAYTHAKSFRLELAQVSVSQTLEPACSFSLAGFDMWSSWLENNRIKEEAWRKRKLIADKYFKYSFANL